MGWQKKNKKKKKTQKIGKSLKDGEGGISFFRFCYSFRSEAANVCWNRSICLSKLMSTTQYLAIKLMR